MQNNITVYGNFFLDEIYCLDSELNVDGNNFCGSYNISYGGIANFIRGIHYFDPHCGISAFTQIGSEINKYDLEKFAQENRANLYYNISEDYKTSRSVILLDKKSSRRTSVTSWGACVNLNFNNIQASNWHHIAYLDKLYFLRGEHIDEMCKSGQVSGDLCLQQYTGQQKSFLFKEIFPRLQYLFLSHKEAAALNITSNVARTATIIHAPHSIEVLTPNAINNINLMFDSIENLNVLGAGDLFAACCVNYILTHKKLNSVLEIQKSMSTCLKSIS